MKRLFLTLFALVLSVGLGLSTAEAKRLGGGKSIGMQRSTPSQPATATPPSATAPSAAAPGTAAAAQPRRNSWLGPVAGLAAGLGLAALASHLGFGEEFGNIMLIALLVMAAFMVFRLLTRRRAQAAGMQYAGAGAGAGGGVPPMQYNAQSAMPAAASAAGGAVLPAGFDAEGFAREAKLNFLRLQAANDAGNLDDLREFTAPEVFAELQMQVRERGAAANQTEVMDLKAEVLECVEEGGRYIASVRFHGLLREEAGAPPADFDEVWHLVKPVKGNRGWQVAGIQQRI
jgi:predicted lipid-binding transport protein (Tim44 family)